MNKKENAFDGLIVLINGHGDIGKDDGEMKGKRCKSKYGKQDRTNSTVGVVCKMLHYLGFLTVEGQPMYVDDLMERFSDTNCPLLVGKPKLFFIDVRAGSHHQCFSLLRAFLPHSRRHAREKRLIRVM